VFGVSPAFVLSGYGHDFSLENYCEALPRIQRIGFDAFQSEIYTAAAAPEWLQGGGDACSGSSPTSDGPTQFVAHFMLACFATEGRLGPGRGCDEEERIG
jgi:hypothetical protein